MESIQRVEVKDLAGVRKPQQRLGDRLGLGTSCPKVKWCIDKGLQIGALAPLSDQPHKGRRVQITLETRA